MKGQPASGEGRIEAKPQGRGRKGRERRKGRPEATFIFVYYVTNRPWFYNSDLHTHPADVKQIILKIIF